MFGSPRDLIFFFQPKVPTEFLGAYKLDLVKALEVVVAVDEGHQVFWALGYVSTHGFFVKIWRDPCFFLEVPKVFL